MKIGLCKKITDCSKKTPKDALIFLAFVIFSLSIYAPALKGPFLLDDRPLILNNLNVTNLGRSGLLFLENLYHFSDAQKTTYYRPLTALTYAIDWAVWKENTLGFHLTNILLHATASFLFFLLLRQIFAQKITPLGTSFLFCAHPLQTSAVAYISGRADPLAAMFLFFSLLTLTKFLQKGSLKLLASSLFLCLLAQLSRESGLLAPILCLTLLLFIRSEKRKMVLAILGITFITLSMIIWRSTILNNLAYPQIPFAVSPSFAATLLKGAQEYINLLIKPWPLYLMRPLEASVAIHPLFLLLLAWAIFWAARDFIVKKGFFSFGMLWTIATSWPLFFLIQSNSLNTPLIAEHWLYLPLAGIALMIWSFFRDAAILFRRLRINPETFWIIAIFALGAITFHQNRLWGNKLALLTHQLNQSPENSTFLLELADELNHALKPAAARNIYQKILSQKTFQSWKAANQLGNMALVCGDFRTARSYYEEAIALQPDQSILHANLGIALNASGEKEKSFEALEKALALNPESLVALEGLGDWCISSDLAKEALTIYEKIGRLHPSHPRLPLKIAIALIMMGRLDEAHRLLSGLTQKDLKVDEMKAIARAYVNAGEPDEAIAFFEKSLQLQPQDEAIKRDLVLARSLLEASQ